MVGEHLNNRESKGTRNRGVVDPAFGIGSVDQISFLHDIFVVYV